MMKRSGVWLVLLALIGGLGCARGGARLPLPLGVEEFVIPWGNAFPSDVVVDEAGLVWFTDRLAHVIGTFDVETGRFERIALPRGLATPYGLLRSPDGALWFASSESGRLGRVEPGTREITVHELAGARGGPHLIAWHEGRIWFTLREGRGFGRYDPRSGETRIFEPEGRPRLYSIAAGRNGHLWLSVIDGPELYEVDPGTETYRVHELSEPAGPGEPWAYVTVRDSANRSRTVPLADSTQLALVPKHLQSTVRLNRRYVSARRLAVDGRGSVWVTDFHGARVVRFDPAAETIVSYATGPSPYGMAASPGGRHIWYGEARGRTVVVLDAETGEKAEVRVASQGTIRHLAVDEARHRVWLPLSDVGRLGMVRLAPPSR